MLKITILSTLGIAGICAIAASAQTANVNTSAAAFLTLAAEADMTTTNLSKTAEGRAVKEEVKYFAKKLASDHTTDYQQLCELATKTGQSIPKGIDNRDNREIVRLERAKGKTFDREFLVHERIEHEKLVRAFKDEADHASNVKIKAYASKALPTIEAHLHEVQDLLKSKA